MRQEIKFSFNNNNNNRNNCRNNKTNRELRIFLIIRLRQIIGEYVSYIL